MGEAKNTLLVWVPAYNEEENIAAVISHLYDSGYDFVVCDGYSTDNTVRLAKEAGAEVFTRTGFGKGYAVQDGLNYAIEHGYEYLVLIDCDQTYPVEDISRLAALADDADMVVGCRSTQDMTFLRRLANIIMTSFVNLLYGASIRDMASGLRLLRVSSFKGLISARTFDVEPQMCGIALRRNLRIREIDINYRVRGGEGKSRVWDLISLFRMIIAERFRKY